MKIVTVNVPESYLESIERLVSSKENPNGIYPSRSELIRVAVREFLIKELKIANEIIKYKEIEVEELDDKNLVRVPIEKKDENNEPVREFKTYKIVRRLSYNESEKPGREDNGEFIWASAFNESYDPNPQLPDYTPPSLTELRTINPDLIDYKYINEE